MKLEAIFNGECARVLLLPETKNERILLGSVLGNATRGSVRVSYEGHPSDLRVSQATISLLEEDTPCKG
jgi:hypothetical protein